METFDAIYQAVRSKIQGCNVSDAVENALRGEGIGHHAQIAFNSIAEQFYDYSRPSVLFKPRLFLDGDKWYALYGENMQEGCVAFGDSPAQAMTNFDAEFVKKVKV